METTLENLNPFGRYQKLMLALFALTAALPSMTLFSTVFTTAKPKILCTNNATSIDRIERSELAVCAQRNNNTLKNQTTCVYDRSHYGVTIVTEWDLICEKAVYRSLTQTLYLVGSFSSLFIGYFCDKYGRKRITLIVLSLLSFTLGFCQFLQFNFVGLSEQAKYIVFSVAQVVIGAGSNGLYVSQFSLLIELTTSKYSALVSTVNMNCYVLGELLIVVFAYFIRNWHLINWFLTATSIAIIPLCYLFLPESPKYLVQKKKYHLLNIELKKIAKCNGKMYVAEDGSSLLVNGDENQQTGSNETSILIFLIKSKQLIIRTAMLGFVWISLSLAYIGISLGITSVSNDINPYLIYTLAALSESIGYSMVLVTDRLGRKRMFIVYMCIASVMCLLVSLIQLMKDEERVDSGLGPKAILILVFTSLGKAMNSAAYCSAYVYTSQMFPTRVRTTTLFFISSVGRMGGIIAPQINLLGDLVWRQLPYLLFSLSSFIGCIFIVLMPDPSSLNYL